MRTPRRQGHERAPTAPTTVSLELQQVLSNLPNAAAYVVNPALRILAANRVATALGGVDRLGRALHYLFTDPPLAHIRIHHPEVGRMTLSYRTFGIRDVPGQLLIVATAPPGSPSADALTLLGILDATRNREHPQLTNGRQ